MRPLPSFVLPFALLGGLLLFLPCPTARAEEGEGLDEVSKQVREQMEKIIRLMQENEAALLEISTGRTGQKPKAIDVTPPALPPSEGGSASGTEGADRGDGRQAGQEAVRTLEEMIRGQRTGAGEIPRQLEELVRMVPQ